MHSEVKKYHFVGIGGIGMCGLAEYLLYNGQIVTGSDLAPSENTERLEKQGAKIKYGHRRENVGDCDYLVYSSAVKPDNPERMVATECHIPTLRRAELLGQIFATKSLRIAVSGTHGKTTTTAMIGQVLTKAGMDPLILSGGILKNSGSPIQIGHGEIGIAEADEFDRSFLQLSPTYAIITNIESEHLDCYENLTQIKNAFYEFTAKIPDSGRVIACSDEKEIPDFLKRLERPYTTYGLYTGEFQARNIRVIGNSSTYEVYRNSDLMGSIQLNVPGLHNIKNALAAITTASLLNVPFSVIQEGLAAFRGVKRRFEILREDDNLMLVDDYAHHPSEIMATLSAARQGWPRRIVAVFQPHLFSRTRDFYADFARVLQIADVIVLLEIYPAREAPLKRVSSRLIYDEIRKDREQNVYLTSTPAEALALLKKIKLTGDMIITLGAGDVNKILPKLME
ncbi:MAG TPA: UDP-N-acetylmuramate--L-alanine ligase [Candidatus Marinimicrobia bacterium]|nr:UDP-N-acetylmuramate--L-alanine ligase [Candidatus Neomarinimicrobiota bacterium]HRS51700.1 UDP-N-acetylmuramate--L-alanine ligase [Candidatus Neomarinimicrobiota bacterium]HRU92150.1 UDP-N-acetylmuramate--L-alanine ligase [Candidatus Neomarinimicrobiota bacterium]